MKFTKTIFDRSTKPTTKGERAFFAADVLAGSLTPQKTDYEAVEPDLAALNKLKSRNAFSFFELLALLKPNLS